MDNEFPYDDELYGKNLPTLAEFERVIRANLQGWLNYLKGDPPLADLKDNAKAIMEDLGHSTFIIETTPLATELAAAVGEKFSRLKLWQSWHYQLLMLLNPVAESPSGAVQEAFHESMMRFYLYKGDLNRANMMINFLSTIAQPKPEIQLAEARVAIALAYYKDGLQMAQQMVKLAREARSGALLGRAYSVLTHLSINLSDWGNAFQYGQMVYSTGIGLGDHTLISDGLHFIALAYKLSPQPRLAYQYLDLAAQYSLWTEDLSHIDYLWDTWAACHFVLGEYDEAQYFYRISLRVFEGAGSYYARALHGLGTSLVLLGCYDEAEPILDKAYYKWCELKRPIEHLYTSHALAELYSCTKRHEEATALMESTISEAKALGERCPQGFLDLLRTDLKVYIARRDDPNANDNAVC
ncbi:MAG: tetratricopeptide repeat protein [Chloroflexota bacterium]